MESSEVDAIDSRGQEIPCGAPGGSGWETTGETKQE